MCWHDAYKELVPLNFSEYKLFCRHRFWFWKIWKKQEVAVSYSDDYFVSTFVEETKNPKPTLNNPKANLKVLTLCGPHRGIHFGILSHIVSM
jgi:hypothetical protein